MKKKTKNVLIIGAGIHGCFLAKYLNKFKFLSEVIDLITDLRDKDFLITSWGEYSLSNLKSLYIPVNISWE